ncbi:hypothetical protein COCOBI_03-6380 [Coccomyxa sp. Obi]|nr:hypothetical protein COCOBI_03-6380 [Coccomyxa sp. Obi]
MTTICKKSVDIAQYIDSDGNGHQIVLSMPFTSKSGFGDAQNGLPQLHVTIHATLLEVDQVLEADESEHQESVTKRADSVISGLTSDGDEAPYRIKSVKAVARTPSKDLSAGSLSFSDDAEANISWPSDPDKDVHLDTQKQYADDDSSNNFQVINTGVESSERDSGKGGVGSLNLGVAKQPSWSLDDADIVAIPTLKRLSYEASMDGEPSAISTPAPDTPKVPDWWGAAIETQSKEGQNITDSSRLRQATNAHQYSETTSMGDRHEEHAEELADALAMVGALEGRCDDAMLRIADLEEDNMALGARMAEAVKQLEQVREEKVHLQEEMNEAAAIRQQCREQQLLIQRLEYDFERQRDAVQLLRGEKEALEDAVSAKEEAQAKCDALQGEMKELKSAIQSQEVELHGLEQENVQLQEKLHVSDEAIEDLKLCNKELRRENASLEASAMDLRCTVAAHAAKQQALQLEKAELETQASL